MVEARVLREQGIGEMAPGKINRGFQKNNTKRKRKRNKIKEKEFRMFKRHSSLSIILYRIITRKEVQILDFRVSYRNIFSFYQNKSKNDKKKSIIKKNLETILKFNSNLKHANVRIVLFLALESLKEGRSIKFRKKLKKLYSSHEEKQTKA